MYCSSGMCIVILLFGQHLFNLLMAIENVSNVRYRDEYIGDVIVIWTTSIQESYQILTFGFSCDEPRFYRVFTSGCRYNIMKEG